MRQTLFSIKRNLKNKVKVFLPVLFLALFLFPATTKAQSSTTVNYDQFKCLFEKANCLPVEDEVTVGKGEASGVLYGQTNTFTKTGVTSITMKIGLWLDLAKERGESKYFYGRVSEADTSATNGKGGDFFIKFNYTLPGTTITTNYFVGVPYQKNDFEIQSSWASPVGINSVNTGTTSGGSAQTKIAFYKVGPSRYEVVTQQIVLSRVTLDRGSEIPYGQTVEAELWYCGGIKGTNSEIDGRYAPREEGRIEYFTRDGIYTDINGRQTNGRIYSRELCEGTAAYKIGTTRTFKLPSNKEEAQASSEENIQSGITASTYIGSVLPLCSIDPFTDGSVMGCIAQILYGGVFRPVAFFAQLMGKLFDFFIGYSLSDESYRHDFVQTGWQLVRDISNIFFIIIMIYSGLAAVFSTSNVSYKKVIPTLIINALIINFSLFATRVVIDMSNITARIFYNQMVVKVDGETAGNSTGFKPISEAIVSSFNPQKIFEGSVLQSEVAVNNSNQNTESDPTTFNGQADASQSTGGFKRYSKEYAGYFSLVTLVAIAISFSMAMMFWKTAFLFVGRVIGLYVAMIFSPFAFLSRGGVPLVNKVPSLNYGSWWKDLSQYALLAPIFVFFLYIINAFLNVEFFTKVGLDQNGQGFFGSVMYVVIPMLIIYGLVTRGVGIANSLAGDFGKMVQEKMSSVGGAVVGGALGIATGGVAVAGRNVIGRLGSRLASSQTLQNASSRGGILGGIADRTIRSGNYLSRATYDARNNNFVGSRLREFGNTNSVVGRITGTNQVNTTGGFQGAIQREAESQNRRADRMLLTGEQAAVQDARNTAWENTYQTARNNAQQQANNNGVTFDENNFRTTYLANQATAGNTRPETSVEINRRREQQNNARLQRGSTLARIARRASNRITTPAGIGGGATSGAGLAAGAIGAAAAGGLATAAATVLGEGAIQNAAQQQVARQRSSNARDPISPTQRTNLQNRLSQLQAELTRRISLMNTIGSTFNPPITYNNLTPANVIDYQANRQADINSRQTQIDNEQDFVDRNKNNPAMSARVNQARSNIRNLTNQQNNLKNDIRQAGNVLNEFNRIQTDINGVRTQLGI